MESEQDENIELLLHCAEFGGLERIKSFIEVENVDVNSTDKKGLTALHKTAGRGYSEVVKYLLSKGANVNHKTECDDRELCGITPLVYAVKNGHVDVVKALIEHNANIDVIVNNCTLLDLAILTDNPSMIDLILNLGVDVDEMSCKGMTPLVIALGKDKYESVRILLEKGADYRKYRTDGASPLFYAVQEKAGGKGTELLLKHVEAKEGKEGVLEYINYNGCGMERTALHMACFCKNCHAVKLLLEYGANVSVKDKDGLVPLHLAVLSDNPSIIDLLLNHGANIDECDSKGRTPLMIALGRGKYKSARLLIERGADYRKYTNDDGSSPLIIAMQEKDDDMEEEAGNEFTEFLLKYIETKEGRGALLEYINYNGTRIGRSALHSACINENYSMAKLLLEHGADHEIKDGEGLTSNDLVIGDSHVCKQIRSLLQSYAEKSMVQ